MAEAPKSVASGQQHNNAEMLRQAVAHQPTLVGSITALIAGTCGMIQQCLDKADPAALQGLVDSMADDLGGWVNAVMANTSQSLQTAEPFTAVPPNVQEAFDRFAAQAATKAEAQQQRQEAHQQRQ